MNDGLVKFFDAPIFEMRVPMTYRSTRAKE